MENNTHYFQVSDGLSEELRSLLNKKIDKIRLTWEKLNENQLKYVATLNRKLYLYENVAPELHGLISMPLAEIFNGIKVLAEKPDVLWQHILATFGREFFLPTIDREYGHLFVNDIGRYQEEIQKAVQGAKDAQGAIMSRAAARVSAIQVELDEVEDANLELRSKIWVEAEKAATEADERTKKELEELYSGKIETLTKRVEQLSEERRVLTELTKNAREAMEKEQLKTAFAKFIFYAKSRGLSKDAMASA